LFAIHDGEIDGFSLDRSRDVVKLFEEFGELFQAQAQSIILLFLLHIMQLRSIHDLLYGF
jgi:hypothetical protein